MKLLKITALILAGIFIGIIIPGILLEVRLRHSGRCALQGSYNEGLNEHMARFRLSKNIMLGWEYDPEKYQGNSAGYGVNSLGLVDKEYSLNKPEGTYRIVVLGDSITEQGWYVKYLEEFLNRNDEKKKYEVLNCGVGGYQLTQYYYYLKERAMVFDPDMVIIGFCLNDFSNSPIVIRRSDGKYMLVANPLDGFTDNEPVFGLNSRFFLNSYLYRYVIVALQNRYYRYRAQDSEKNKALTETLLEKIEQLTRRKNIRLIGVIIPFFTSEYDRRAGVYEYTEMKDSLIQSRVEFIDLHGKFHNIDDPAWRSTAKDYIHPSKKGHRVIAENIYEYITQKGYFQKHKTVLSGKNLPN